MGSHQSAKMKSDTWLTPPDIIERLGTFDLDPCCPAIMPWVTANTMLHAGSVPRDWNGRVWLNPPYSREASKWLKRISDHGNGIALIFARTETRWFRDYVWSKASGILFISGRIHFHLADGSRAKANAGAPSCLVSYGINNLNSLRESNIAGYVVSDWRL